MHVRTYAYLLLLGLLVVLSLKLDERTKDVLVLVGILVTASTTVLTHAVTLCSD